MVIDRTRLVRLREQRGWRNADLAAAASLSRPFMSQIENGTREPSPLVVKELADALGVTIDELTPGTDWCPTCHQRIPQKAG